MKKVGLCCSKVGSALVSPSPSAAGLRPGKAASLPVPAGIISGVVLAKESLASLAHWPLVLVVFRLVGEFHRVDFLVLRGKHEEAVKVVELQSARFAHEADFDAAQKLALAAKCLIQGSKLLTRIV